MKIRNFAIMMFCFVACKTPAPEIEVQSETSIASRGQNQEEEQVLQRIEAYYQVFSDREWDAFRNFFWDDATLTTIWQPAGAPGEQVVVTSINDFIKQTPLGPDSQPVFEERMNSAEIKLEESLAQVWADYEATFGQPDSLMHWTGRDAFTLLKHHDEWRIVSLVFLSE